MTGRGRVFTGVGTPFEVRECPRPEVESGAGGKAIRALLSAAPELFEGAP